MQELIQCFGVNQWEYVSQSPLLVPAPWKCNICIVLLSVVMLSTGNAPVAAASWPVAGWVMYIVTAFMGEPSFIRGLRIGASRKSHLRFGLEVWTLEQHSQGTGVSQGLVSNNMYVCFFSQFLLYFCFFVVVNYLIFDISVFSCSPISSQPEETLREGAATGILCLKSMKWSFSRSLLIHTTSIVSS